MKKKIAVLSNSMKGGGAERYLYYVLKYFQDDYEIHLILTEDKVEYELPKSQIIHYLNKDHHKVRNYTSTWELPKFLLKIPLYSYRLIKYCRENEINLIFSLLSRPNFTACFAKVLGYKGKVLIGEQTYIPAFYKKSTIKGKVGQKVVSILYPKADLILPNSKGIKESLENEIGVKNDYKVVKNFLDIEEIESKKNVRIKDVDFNNFTFVHLGGFRIAKDHPVLIKAFAELEDKSCRLLLLGKGRWQAEYEELAEKLGVKDRINFYGHCRNPFPYLKKSDCFVLSSIFEGFPNVLLEAMVCDLPIVSTDCRTGPRELLAPETDFRKSLTDEVEQVKYGILVPTNKVKLLAQAMQKMIDDKKLRKEYSRLASERLREYDSKTVAKEFREILENYLIELD